MVGGAYKPFRVLPGTWESHQAAYSSPPRPLPLAALRDPPGLLAAPDLTGPGPPPLDLVGVHVHGAGVAEPAEPALLLTDGLMRTDEMAVLPPIQLNTGDPMGLKGGKSYA